MAEARPTITWRIMRRSTRSAASRWRLLIVQAVSLAAGQAATVVLVDKAGGGIDAVLIRDR